jgi:hypothetical protein
VTIVLFTVAYDANGNTLTDPSGKSYSWDSENRLELCFQLPAVLTRVALIPLLVCNQQLEAQPGSELWPVRVRD